MGMLACLYVVPAARQGQRLLSVLAVVLIRLLCWAWECSDSSNDGMPRLAGASAGLLPCCPGEAATPGGAEPTGCDLGMTPQRITPGWRRDLSSIWPGPCCSRHTLKHQWLRSGVPQSSCPLPTTCLHPLFHVHLPRTLEAALLSEEALGKQLSVTRLKWFALATDIHKYTIHNRIKAAFTLLFQAVRATMAEPRHSH